MLPWIATAITSNEDFTVWTMKLRQYAVFQDGTPITAADFKAYWEHGAKPENAVAWGGAEPHARRNQGLGAPEGRRGRRGRGTQGRRRPHARDRD